MTTNTQPAALSPDVVRSYDRLVAQITWLLGERGLDEASLARGVIAAMRGEPIGAPFTTGAQRNVVARLAWLWLWRAPWLSPSMLVSGPLELEALAAGQGTMVAAVQSIRRLELDPAGDALAIRGHRILGEESSGIDDLWSSEEAALRPCITALRERLGSSDGAAFVEELSAALAAQASRANVVPADGPLPSAADYVARARQTVGTAFVDPARTRVAAEKLTRPFADADAALALEPDHVDALVLRAQLRALSNVDLEGAKRDVARAIELDPGCGRTYLVLGLVLRAAGDLTAGGDAFSRALAAERPEAMAHVFRGVHRIDSGDLEGAAADAAAAISLLPRAPASHALLGRVRALRGDRDGALEAFGVALVLDPSYAGAYAWRAEVWGAGGDARRALDDYDRAVALSGDPAVLYNRGTFKIGVQDLLGAESDLTAALESNPNDAQALLNRGTVRAMRKDVEGTLADFRRAAAAAPDYAPARMKYGLVLCDLGRAREGRTELEAALACAPRDWPHRGEIERVIRSLRA